MAKQTFEEKMKALKKKLDTVSSKGGFWSPNKGDNLIRILPEVGDMEFFFQEVGLHTLPDKTKINCPRFTSEGEYDCPICELVTELYNGDEDDREMAGNIRARKKFYMNIIVRDKDDDGSNTGSGPFVYAPGITVLKAVQAIINSPDYGDITDLDKGFDVVVRKTGDTWQEIEYNVTARRFESPLHQDEAKEDDWLAVAKDLSYVMLSDESEEDAEHKNRTVTILPYDRIIDEFGIGPGMDVSPAKTGKKEEKHEDPFPPPDKPATRERRKVKQEEVPEEETDEVSESIADGKKKFRRRRRKS